MHSHATRIARTYRVVIFAICCAGLLMGVGGCASSSLAQVPRLASSYLGKVRNTTSGLQSPVTLTMHQTGTHLDGEVVFSFPLAGSGALTGALISATSIEFRVTSLDAVAGVLLFRGTSADNFRTMNGTYLIDNGQEGTWIDTQNTI